MSGELTYGKPVLSRSGAPLPAFADGKAMYSRYSHERDAQSFATWKGISEAGCILIFGLGNGAHVAAVMERNPEAHIIVAEYSQANIDFLKLHFDISPITGHSAVTLCTIDMLEPVILQTYIPVLHGPFLALYQPVWKRYHAPACASMEQAISSAMEEIQKDYTTQRVFGKLWHRNILQNLRTALRLGPEKIPHAFSSDRQAFVIAAGPSLDRDIPILKSANCYIAVVDTAFPALLRRHIIPDLVYTLDGQIFSARHFMLDIPPATVLAADLCCNPVIPRLFAARGGRVVFTGNSHPLCRLFARFLEQNGAADAAPPEITSGAGTVTVGAYDLACQAGFQDVAVIGADFAYINGKPYASGTYFEDAFHSLSRRLDTAEGAYTALMYRGATVTGVREGSRIITTPLLDSYKASLKNRMADSSPYSRESRLFLDSGNRFAPFVEDFLRWYLSALEHNLKKNAPQEIDSGILASCLPLAAWANKKNPGKFHLFSILKLAYNLTERYTAQYEGDND